MSSTVETYALAKKFEYFRTTDVVDALDAVGRADLTLMDERIKPLWQGIRFWGPAVTVRALPANIRMPVLSPEEAIRIGFKALELGASSVYCSASPWIIEAMARERIPVVGHLGMVPSENLTGPIGRRPA